MEVLRTISFYAEAKGVEFLIIGGHAVNHYGLSRQTGDIDLIVRRSKKAWWEDVFERLRYEIGQNDDRFARFRPKSLADWPIDLMFVDDATFKKLLAQAEQADLGVAAVRVVSARHLATLKIHALKHYQPHRYAKDYNDLLWLLRSGRTGLGDEELRELCERYASEDLYAKVVGDWGKQ